MILEDSTSFEDQHKGLNRFFKEYQDQKATNIKKVKELFSKFASNLQRHILWEDRVLIPVLRSDKNTSHDRSIDLIRSEHIKILAYLKDLNEKLDKDLAVEKEEERLLLNILKHKEFEDEVLHPTIIKLIKAESKEDIFNFMDNLKKKEGV